MQQLIELDFIYGIFSVAMSLFTLIARLLALFEFYFSKHLQTEHNVHTTRFWGEIAPLFFSFALKNKSKTG